MEQTELRNSGVLRSWSIWRLVPKLAIVTSVTHRGRRSVEHGGSQRREGGGYGRYVLSGSYLRHVSARTLG
jgi:hypothetical protein